MCKRELETEQNCNILTPTLLAITAFLSRSPGLLNRGSGGRATLGAGFLYHILSPTRLIPNWLIGGLKAPLGRCWLSLPHLVSNWLNSLCTELNNSWTYTFFLWASQFHTHSTCLRSRLYYPDIPRPDAPVIYTGAFPILTARQGRRSICNKGKYNGRIYQFKWGDHQ